LLDALCGDAAGHFTLLLQGHPPDVGVMACVQRWQQRGVPLQVIQLAMQEGPPAPGVRRVLADADGRLQQRLGLAAAGGAYLLRPDQHVCGRWRALSADRLDHALHQALGQP
ncbi:MAG: hypothetical protein Q7T32_09920, partial [Moraxellaceae bacterium]|nr:hypothetical protein [Moraxellaceae bacterium]